jgi:ATP-dependent helicase STH1/SNF2
LLREENSKEEIELITSDFQINSLIARNEEEFALYEKMDKEREEQEEQEWRAKGNTGPRPARYAMRFHSFCLCNIVCRLLQEHELPEYMQNDEALYEVDLTEQYGRGRRGRQEVVYDDNMSEAQFVKVNNWIYLE